MKIVTAISSNYSPNDDDNYNMKHKSNNNTTVSTTIDFWKKWDLSQK